MSLIGKLDPSDSVYSEFIGISIEGREIPVVHFMANGEHKAKVLLIGLQHGDEHAGKEALIQLIKDAVESSNVIPEGIDLWIVPMANPDGNDTNQRRNAANFDLNRDHLILSQPETRALHALVADLRPDVIVDCHEFRRDTGDYIKRGWLEWPLIMLGSANSPLLPDEVFHIGRRWIEQIAPAMDEAGHNYARYHVGSAPGAGEMRYSTLECDDARNGLGLYGGLSFIIESGVWREAEDPQANLDERVAAYRTLLDEILKLASNEESDIQAVRHAWERPVPDWIVTNAFWGNTKIEVTNVPVIDALTSDTIHVATPNFMKERVSKDHVSMPSCYLMSFEAADYFSPLLKGHSIAFTTIEVGQSLLAERSILETVEEEWDSVHSRYGGRQLVTIEPRANREFSRGSLWVPLDSPEARRAAAVLEPAQLYGLWQWDEWRTILPEDGTLPVWRVFEEPNLE